MQSIIDKLQSPASFSDSIEQLIISLQRSGDPANLCQMQKQFELLSQIDASTEAACPEWNELEQAMSSVYSVVQGLVDFLKSPNNSRYKSRMCRNHARGGCPKGLHCPFAHSEEELK
ncbi:roquin-1-like [Orbicella faveolata]|uniref:roquin-1-like n=1 Tax=Orbicella faveolata TaxID=48498 RepID=UPI0009E319E8|nr:roquin-1-like [Orbicella faveolata]